MMKFQVGDLFVNGKGQIYIVMRQDGETLTLKRGTEKLSFFSGNIRYYIETGRWKHYPVKK